MPTFEALAEHSLREYGLFATILILGLLYLIVVRWKQPPAAPQVPPIQSVDERLRKMLGPILSLEETIKLLPLVLEEVRTINRDLRTNGRCLEHMETRLERIETLGQIIRDRQSR